MPRGIWSEKRERQYEHIVASCTDRGGSYDRCRRVAAATVNKTRAVKGESATVGCHCPRGTRPLKSDKSRCYDPSKHKRRARVCVSPAKGQVRR